MYMRAIILEFKIYYLYKSTKKQKDDRTVFHLLPGVELFKQKKIFLFVFIHET